MRMSSKASPTPSVGQLISQSRLRYLSCLPGWREWHWGLHAAGLIIRALVEF